jgi:hypothetical protein
MASETGILLRLSKASETSSPRAEAGIIDKEIGAAILSALFTKVRREGMGRMVNDEGTKEGLMLKSLMFKVAEVSTVLSVELSVL